MLAAGFNIGSLLVEHRGVDFRDERNWACNRNRHPTRPRAYHGVSLHPLEVLFHKAQWHTLDQEVSFREMQVLTSAMNDGLGDFKT